MTTKLWTYFRTTMLLVVFFALCYFAYQVRDNHRARQLEVENATLKAETTSLWHAVMKNSVSFPIRMDHKFTTLVDAISEHVPEDVIKEAIDTAKSAEPDPAVIEAAYEKRIAKDEKIKN